MTTMDELLAKIAKENQAREAKAPKPKLADVKRNAAFLLGWCKGKPIVRQSADATFWAAGKWMTKLDAKMADAIVAEGFGKLTGKSTDAGARLEMFK